MNLREFCRVPGFSIALLTTYDFDPLFFERVVRYDLIAGGSTKIFVIADANQAIPQISSARGQLVALGRSYRLIPVRLKGAFHPKLCVRIGREHALVACGSHNLTRSGWLGRNNKGEFIGNRESTIAWRVDPGTTTANQFKANLQDLLDLPDLAAYRDELLSHLASTWLQSEPTDQIVPAGASWGIFGYKSSLATELERRWQGRKFERLRIVTGSTDYHAAMIRWAASTFGVRKAVVEVDQVCCSFKPSHLKDFPIDLRIKFYDGHPRTHLKAAFFESADGDGAAVVGSANCSASAWLKTIADGGNIESVVIYDQCGGAELAELFRSDQGEPSSWRDVDFIPPAPNEPQGQTLPFRLKQLQLHRSGGTLTARFETAPGSGSIVHAVVGQSRVPLLPTLHGELVWCGSLPDITNNVETLFGFAEIDNGSHRETTNSIWIEDVDRLAEVAAPRLPIDTIKNLSKTPVSGDYKRLLSDLQLLSKTLLTDPSEFPDVVTIKQQRKKEKSSSEPARPVTAADVIISLDQLATHGNSHPLSSVALGSISLTGIMRLLFGEDEEPAEIDPTKNESGKPEPETPTDNGDDKPPDPSPPPKTTQGDGPTDKQRQKLLEHLKEFKDRLSADSFAKNCSARQLQQAAAYPLAVAQFASRGAWIQDDSQATLDRIVTEVCEVLFCRMNRQKDPKTGEVRTRPPLVEEVRQRYVEQSRVEDFDDIIGDGTLWLVVMGSLAMMREGSEARFVRNLTLRDVARPGALSASVSSEHLAPLAARLWSTSSLDIASEIQRVNTAVNDLEEYLESHFDMLRPLSPRSACVGDWIWRPNVAFAQVTALEGLLNAKAHLRKRAEDLTVRLSYYLNLRQLSECDNELRTLYAAACK